MAPASLSVVLLLATAVSAQTMYQLLPQMYVSWVNAPDYIDLNITVFDGMGASYTPSVHGMSGTGVTGYVNATHGICVDYASYDTNVTYTDTRSTVMSYAFGNPSWIVCRLPKAYYAIRDGPQRINSAVAPFDNARNLPSPHTRSHRSREVWVMDVVAGTVEEYKYRNLFFIPMIVGCAIFVIVGIMSRACRVVLSPVGLMVAKSLFVVLLFVMVAVYCILAGLPYPTLTSTMYATGEGSMLLTGLVMFPISKFFSVGLLLYGTSYERMVPWHVLIGIMLLVMVVLHGTLALIAIGTQEPRGLTAYLNLGWQKRGNVYPIPGIIAMTFLLALALPAMLRRLSYRIFRYTHFFLIPFLVFAILHYILVLAAIAPSAVLFLLDVVKRYAPTVLHGKAAIRDATTSGELVRVRLAVPWRQVDPGDYALLSHVCKCADPIPHPFTIAAMDYDTNEATFIIKRSGSWTRDFFDGVQAKTITDVMVQGPYGSLMVPITSVDRVLLISGGIGVTPMFSIAMAALEASKPVRFVWVVRNGEDTTLALPLLQAMRSKESKEGDLNIEIYVTGKAALPSLPTSLMVGITQGRPNVDSILSSDSTAVNSGGKLGVYTCGPAVLTDSVASLTRNYSNARLHVETFEL